MRRSSRDRLGHLPSISANLRKRMPACTHSVQRAFGFQLCSPAGAERLQDFLQVKENARMLP